MTASALTSLKASEAALRGDAGRAAGAEGAFGTMVGVQYRFA